MAHRDTNGCDQERQRGIVRLTDELDVGVELIRVAARAMAGERHITVCKKRRITAHLMVAKMILIVAAQDDGRR